MIPEGTGEERRRALRKLIDIARGSLPLIALWELLRFCQAGTVRPHELLDHVDLILDIWNRVYVEVAAAQQEGGPTEWLFDAEYADKRELAAILLDLFGYVDSSVSEPALQKALRLIDPRLKAFAALSMIRHGETVPLPELESIAVSDEMRIVLWESLNKLMRPELMPEQWSAPEQLAASDLVRWTSHEMELGIPPEDVELMDTFLVNFEGTEVKVFIFRFREFPKPWEPGEGWMAAIAGPFLNGERLGSPYSAFDSWGVMAPEEHFKKLMANACWCEMDYGQDTA